MAKPIPTLEYEALLNAVAQFPAGASIEQIEFVLASQPARRTLQRWLFDLIDQQRIHKVGQARGTRYLPGKVVHLTAHGTAQAQLTAHAEILIPLSDEAKSIEAHVRQPLQKRTPVGYKQSFLDGYRPNETFYLSKSTRAELLACGQAANADAPAGTYARQIAHRLLIDLS